MNVALSAQRLDYISLCTGGGGLDLGLELASPGARAVCMVEREAFAAAHLVAAMQQGLLAACPLWSDARTFDGRAWRGLVDGVIGGIPCQPHSLAGQRLAEEDDRDLWSAARRIIVQSGAWFAFIENVGGMLTSGGAERVWRDLHRLGFSVEGGLFAAEEVGPPHQRERLFILAVVDAGRSEWRPRIDDRAQSAEPECGKPRLAAIRPAGLRTAVADTGGAGSSVGRSERANARPERASIERGHDFMGNPSSGDVTRERRSETHHSASGCGEYRGSGRLFPPGPGELDAWRAVLDRAPELEPAVRRMADGLAASVGSRVDELRLLGNGVVPLQAAYAWRTLATRLARRNALAGELVRMMGEQTHDR